MKAIFSLKNSMIAALSFVASLSFFPQLAFSELAFTNEVLQTEDVSMIVDSIPLSQETFLEASPEDIFRAKVVAIINKSQCGEGGQTIKIYIDGKLEHQWLVSTGREKLERAASRRVYVTTTPVGYFRPTRVVELHRSVTWNADMPHAVFFIGGIATHATTHLEQLGTRASGGCVRLSPEHAEIFYNLVRKVGVGCVTKINRDGTDLKNELNEVVQVDGYDVLIIVENK